MHRPHVKIIAFLLLLVFSQRTGLRMWMHHWLHESRTTASCQAPASDRLQFRCDCFDDLVMPLLGSPVFTVRIPERDYITLGTDDRTSIPATETIFYSLKGPPLPLPVAPAIATPDPVVPA